jgi:3-hydroxymyristoyl/3-hydroxydecanoyl-(acyl carrier protein) dehydratase
MTPRFRAFSFVDRIDELTIGRSAAGRYAVPGTIEAFPTSLVAEAVGQLAAWSVMAARDFRIRPVAGIAGRIELAESPEPGEVLTLSAGIDSLDDEAVTYHGEAHANGRTLVRLFDCIGPLLPMDEFDEPAEVRDQFERLRADGVGPGGFAGLPDLPLVPVPGTNGSVARAELTVPATLALFGDHFPRRPVLPGTILMHQNLRLAHGLAAGIPARAPGTGWKAVAMNDVKIRAFTPPGERIELVAQAGETTDGPLVVTVESRMKGRMIAGSRIEFEAGVAR